MEPNVLYRFATPPFQMYKRDVFSKHGEDGIIEEILGRLGELRPNNLVVDCQAVSPHCSLARNLVTNHGFRAEASSVSHGPSDAIAVLCIECPAAWDVFDAGSPMVVVARIDPTVPPPNATLRSSGAGESSDGATFASMVDVGARKGYSAVAHAGTNMVLVRTDLTARLGVPGITFRDPNRVFEWHAVECA